MYELVGLFLLDRLASVLGKENIGLYRDDGLSVLRNKSGPTMERTRKKITWVFQIEGLRITSECYLSRTDFLDMCFDLNEEICIPYRKSNNTLLYIHARSNHPPMVKKHLPQMIGHNKQVLNRLSSADTETSPCNCRNKRDCPLEGKCRTKFVIYKASIRTPNGNTMSYYGCCETDFKAHYYNHKQSFKTSFERHQTELSKLVWRLKDEGHIPVKKWSIVCKAKPYSSSAMHCQLCLTEKLAILRVDPDTTLNGSSELVAKCRHHNKYKLIKIPP